MITLKRQQAQDPVLKTVYFWITQNTKPDSLTPQITVTPHLHAYSKDFSQPFIDDSTILISIYSKTNPDLISKTLKPIFKICSFRLFKTAFDKLHDHCHTGIKIT